MEQNEKVEENKVTAEPELAEAPQKEGKKPKSKVVATVASLVVVVLLISAAFYYVKRSDGDSMSSGVIATVNGEKIIQADYDDLYKKLLPQIQASGNAEDAEYLKGVKAQLIDGLVNDKVLMQYAKKAGISVTQDEINTEMATIVERVGGEEKFNAQMTQEGLTREKLESDLKDQVIIKKYLLANIDLNSLNATEEEIQTFYDEASKGQEGVPALDEVRSQISDKIVKDKQQQAINDLVAKLRASSDVKIF